MAHTNTPEGAGIALLNYFSGFALTSDSGSPNSKIDVARGMCADSASAVMISYPGGTIDFTTVGPGGLDTGSIGANQTYNLFSIQGGIGGAAISGAIASLAASPSFANAPGYSTYRLIGAVQTNGSSHLIPSNITTAPIITLTGDVIGSGNGIVPTTVAKVNGVSYPSGPSTNTVPVVTALGTATYETVPVAAGGTGDTGSAWATYTPGIIVGSGAFSSATSSGRFKRLGKTVFFSAQLVITTNGSASGLIQLSLPGGDVTAGPMAYAAVNAASGAALWARTSAGGTTILILKYDGSYAGGDANTLLVSGVYEST